MARRSIVLDISAPCDKVARFIQSRDPVNFIAGAAKLVNKSQHRGSLVLTFASARYDSIKVQVQVATLPDGFEYRFRGGLEGFIKGTGVTKGDGCRFYLEAQGEGPLIEEYGGDALSRVLNRIVISLTSVFPVMLQPRAPKGRLGDYFAELFNLLNIAQGGDAKLSGSLQSVAVELGTGSVLSNEGFSPESAEAFAKLFSEAMTRLSEALNKIGVEEIYRVVVSGDKGLVIINVANKISVVTLVQSIREE